MKFAWCDFGNHPLQPEQYQHGDFWTEESSPTGSWLPGRTIGSIIPEGRFAHQFTITHRVGQNCSSLARLTSLIYWNPKKSHTSASHHGFCPTGVSALPVSRNSTFFPPKIALISPRTVLSLLSSLISHFNLTELGSKQCTLTSVLRLIVRSLKRRHQAAALSNQRWTVFQPIRLTRAMADLLRPSILREATSSKVSRRCWSR
jgi:hypothetical protein